MATTTARPLPELHEAEDWTEDGRQVVLRVHDDERNARTLHLSADELQAVVQQAWDQFGIGFQPWTPAA